MVTIAKTVSQAQSLSSLTENPVENPSYKTMSPGSTASTDVTYALAFAHDTYPSARCAVSSSNGGLALFDMRDFHSPIASCSRLQTQGVVMTRFTSTHPKAMCIQVR